MKRCIFDIASFSPTFEVYNVLLFFSYSRLFRSVASASKRNFAEKSCAVEQMRRNHEGKTQHRQRDSTQQITTSLYQSSDLMNEDRRRWMMVAMTVAAAAAVSVGGSGCA